MRRALHCVCLAGYFLLATLLPVRSQITDDDLKSAYKAASTAFGRLTLEDGRVVDPQGPVLEKHVWWLARQWTLRFLDQHPTASTDVVEQRIRELDNFDANNFEVNVFGLDPSSYLIAYGDDVFVAKRHRNGFEIAWDLRRLWPNGYSTGGTEATVQMLPSDAEGNRRFYIYGLRWQGGGQTSTLNLTIWEWRTSRVRLLFAKPFLHCADDPGFSFDGLYLRVPRCTPRRAVWERHSVEWRIRIGRETVEDAGSVSDTPVLDFVDRFLDRLILDKPVGELASKQAIRTLRPAAREIVKNETAHGWGEKELEKYGLQAEIRDWDQRGRRACLVISPHGSDHDFTFVFDITKPHGRLYVTKAKVVTDMACTFAYDYSGGPRPAGAVK